MGVEIVLLMRGGDDSMNLFLIMKTIEKVYF